MTKRSKRTVVTAATVLVLAGGWFFRHQLYNSAVNWRVQWMISDAESALEAGEIGKARQLGDAALMLNPRDPGCLRDLTLLARKLNHPKLAQIQIVTFMNPGTGPGFQENILAWFLHQGNTAYFESLLEAMTPERKNRPTVRLLSARSLMIRDRVLEAIPMARELAMIEETREDAQLLLTELLPRLSNNSIAWREANSLIRQLVETGTPHTSLMAWRNMSLLPARHRAMGEEFDHVTWISRVGEATEQDRLRAHQLQAEQLPPGRRGEAIDRMQLEFAGDRESLGLLSRWLLGQNEAERLTELDPAPFRDDLMLYTSMLQALIDSGELDQAKSWLMEAPSNFDPIVKAGLEAALLEQSGDRGQALPAWRNLLYRLSVDKDYVGILKVFQIAERFGNSRVVEQSADALLGIPVQSLPASMSLLSMEESFARIPKKWLELWSRIAAERSDDPLAAEQLSILSVLMTPNEADLDELTAMLEPYVDDHPSLTRLETTHCLLLALNGQPEEAVKIFTAVPVDWNTAPDYSQAIYAISLYRARQLEEGRSLARKVDLGMVSPIRARYLSPILQNLL